jgi:hypothetical protein
MKQFILSLLLSCIVLAGNAQDKKQCEHLTTKGKQCMNPAKDKSKFCHVHDDTKPRCEALTQKGVQCQNPAREGKTTCAKHQFVKV